ncbi:hypothetical protein GCM10009665_66600 [Kitasatospora nipponensis]|uniref:Fibronectin type-III domain-containing protein n=1 Tax=Kitasatospora nipponensis TaxID=258049 RepID=A0ABN1WZ51_9ACTN
MHARDRVGLGGRRYAAAIAAAALLGPLALAGSAAAAPTTAAPTTAGAPAGPATATSTAPGGEQALAARARSQGRAVELPDRHTDSSQTFVNPDGTFTYQSYAQPQWRKRGEAWVSLDATLHRTPDGHYAPAVTTSDLVLSGGGDGPLATLTVDGQHLSLRWPHPLPAPSVTGTVATYRDVLPSGVDLQVSATPAGGIQQALVVKNATAAADPALASLTLATETSPGLTLSADAGDNLAVKDAAGHELFTAPAPRMWDSGHPAGAQAAASASTAEGSAAAGPVADAPSDVSGPAASARQAAIHATVQGAGNGGGASLALVPDRTLLTDPGASFPLFLDPSFAPHPASGATQAFDQVQAAYPNTGEYNSPPSVGLAVGFQGFSSPTGVERAYYQLGVPSAIWGTKVLGATVAVTETYSASCGTASRTVNAWSSSPISSATTWSNQPSRAVLQSSVAYAAACNGQKPVGQFNFLNQVTNAAAGHWPNITFGLLAGNESNDLYFSRFSQNAQLSVTYDGAPNVPGSMSVTPSTSTNGTLYTTSGRPTLSASATDPDGDTVQLEYQILADTHVQASGTSGFVTSGTPATWQPGTALADGTYTWQVRSYDGNQDSSWSAPQTFVVATVPPNPPTVDAAGFPAGVWTAPTGGPVNFTLSDTSSGLSGYRYRLDGAPTVNTVTGPGLSLTLAPGWHVLAVAAVDQAGTVSTTVGYAFGIGSAAVTGPADGSSGTGAAVGLAATSAPGLTGVRYQVRSGSSGTFTDIPPGDVSTGLAPLSAWPAATDGQGNAPALTWNAAQTFPLDGPVQVQAVFSDAAGNTVTSAPVGYTLNRPTPPSAPLALSATPHDGSALITWAAPASGGNSPITGYTVTASYGGFTVGSPVTVPAGTLSATVSGLNNGVPYSVSVTASNAAGVGPASTITVTPVAAGAPGPVTAVAVVAGSGQATVYWTAPSSTGGADLTDTVVEIHQVADGALVSSLTVAAPGASAQLTGLPSGVQLYATLVAHNAAGLGSTPVQSDAFQPS